MSKPIRIGTRKSPLALLQAQKVAAVVELEGYSTEIIEIDSAGDLDLVKPIYEMGITGVFTKNLDIALLNNTLDLAVHSLKDVPTILPKGLVIGAVLERDFNEDVVVWNEDSKRDWNHSKIGTGSLRRMAFLTNQYPNIQCENIRGNVQTRLKKMKENNLDGVIFSLAGLLRLDLKIEYENIPHMISAAGQGVIAISCQENKWQNLLEKINHTPTSRCIQIEREFLRTLEGGCSAPIGAYAYEENNIIHFQAGICSVNGTEKMVIHEKISNLEFENQGERLAHILIEKGAQKLLPSED